MAVGLLLEGLRAPSRTTRWQCIISLFCISSSTGDMPVVPTVDVTQSSIAGFRPTVSTETVWDRLSNLVPDESDLVLQTKSLPVKHDDDTIKIGTMGITVSFGFDTRSCAMSSYQLLLRERECSYRSQYGTNTHISAKFADGSLPIVNSGLTVTGKIINRRLFNMAKRVLPQDSATKYLNCNPIFSIGGSHVNICKGISFFSYTWRLGEFLCRFVHYMQNVSMICSVMTLTVMSIERFVAVYYPLRARTVCTVRHARAVIIIVWAMSFIMALPIIFGQKRRTVGIKRTAYWCQKIWAHREYSILYELYMLIVIFIIPVAVMVVTYSLISIEIWNVVTKRADMRSGIVIDTSDGGHTQLHDLSQTSLSVDVHSGSNNRKCLQSKVLTHKEDDRTKRQVILMLVTIVVLFIICWGPILINNVLVAFEMVNLLSEGHLKPIRIAFSLMAYANSCVNPIVYGFMSKNFRKSFKHALCFCWSKRNKPKNINRSATFTTKASMVDSTYKTDRRVYINSNGCYRSNVLEKPLIKSRHRKESDEMMELNVIME